MPQAHSTARTRCEGLALGKSQEPIYMSAIATLQAIELAASFSHFQPWIYIQRLITKFLLRK